MVDYSLIKKRATFGGDPEMFLCDDNGDFVIPPLELYEDGINKENGIQLTKHVRLHIDGPAIEFNITPACSMYVLGKRFFEGLEVAKEFFRKNFGLNISKVSTANFKMDYWKYVPDSIRKVGCNPDVEFVFDNRLNIKCIETKEPPSLGNVRYAGGHIHIGYIEEADVGDYEHQAICSKLLLKMLKKFVNFSYYKHLGRVDHIFWRQTSVYGNPKRVRIKPYGVEVRCIPVSVWFNKEFYTWKYYSVPYFKNVIHSYNVIF